MSISNIKVSTHVGRDVLQTAGLFSTIGKVVWEYLINGIEYREAKDKRKPSVSVNVSIRKKSIEIKDNGHGMNEDRIKQFLTMHGEPIEDKRKLKRGTFGSGKSAAFGIADTLIVDTVCDGKRYCFKLTKDQLKNSDGSNISPHWLVSGEKTEEENGTLVVISKIKVSVNLEDIIKYVERHLHQLMGFDPEIVINDHVCKRKEIDVIETFKFKPDLSLIEKLGDIELVINVSRVALNEEELGIFISAGEGKLIGKDTLGLLAKDMGNLIYGEINVPCLDEEIDGISAYSQARDFKLNMSHKYVKLLIPFLASKAEEVRKELARKKKEKHDTEEGRRLEKLGSEISEVLNESYLDKRKELERIRRGAFGNLSKKLVPMSPDENGDEMGAVAGTEMRANEVDTHRNGESKDNPSTPEESPPKLLNEDEDGSKAADQIAAKSRPQKKGGFQVTCEHLGESLGSRYHYNKEDVNIQINLDHPSVSMAYNTANKNISDITFVRLIYEIAFTAYILAVAQEITEVDEMKTGADLRFEMQELYDEVTLKAKSLYA
ncbi:MAG: ATP-binding protein [Proteobacteria bacterium]|nr:ATP-binding protein [Pseudomonadota bacterium]